MKVALSKLHRLANQKIKASKNVLLATHNKPDGDGLSSVCAIVDYLIELGINHTVYCDDLPANQFDFIPHIEKFTNEKPKNFSDFDLIIPLDCGSVKRTGLDVEIKNRKSHQYIIEFDHHPRVDDYADIELRDDLAASATEVVYDFFKDNGIAINKQRATCILTGISTDTGNFIYPSTSEKTIEISSEMMQRGARLPNILENTWRNKSLSTMKIWGKAINGLKINAKYNIAYTILTQIDIINSGATDEELEGIAGFLSNLEEASALMVLKEEADGTIKGSLRAIKDGVNVSALAQLLGGGGHIKAAGFRVEAKLIKTDNNWIIK